MSRNGYAYEKLLGAVDIMATGKGSRPEKLGRATMLLLRVHGRDLPPELFAVLSDIKSAMTARPARGSWEGRLAASVAQMPWQQAESLSRKLFELFLSVAALRKVM